MNKLSEQTCLPCRGGVPALTAREMAPLHAQVPAWTIHDGHHLERRFAFPDFVSALAFVNRVGALAEEVAHHPDLYLAWGKVDVKIWTHKIDGLTTSDFVLAAKIDTLQA
ncbi:MAG TPA: 4a-hydroxytetrahydrobiopterin dehydratase [Accumulibacter sp.]|uniref:4a-hydroxytetrahydrobiopterin dehydratase n=1 Tax=Accumulibacter sp. TaxID=2053492 RepID=UPI002C42A3AB|nr:4a-hydroxytetrahydrobiopterin dehydratase [Accumulibacter sp.]HNJ51293.1 4a-hydroxytetrahydrobiopterin dehydratase [Accumulibacter sp.]HNM63757.1 4a-hydroxytetrahydrobiopterin dehydratase [Accumulibacter sp.]